MSHCRPRPHPALARAKREAALLQALGLCVSWPQEERGSALGNTCPTHHIPTYTGLQAAALHGNLLQRSHSRAESREGGTLNFTPAKDMRLLCLLHVLWHIHYWECKWKCSSNMLKNSQGAGRERLLCFPGLSKGQKAQKEWHSLGPERERGRALISCLLLMEVRERNSFTESERQQVGKGATGRQARGRGVGAFAVHPAERLCFSQPPSDPSDRPELQGNYGNAALKPSIAFFQFFLRTKQRQ